MALTPRDLEVLIFTGLSGYVSSCQLAREFFPNQDRCQRRLRQLLDAHLVEVHLTASTAPNLVTLSRDGLAALREAVPDVAARIRLQGPIRQAGVAHHLALVDVRCWLAAACAAGGRGLRGWSNAGGDLHQALDLARRYRLVPDAIAEVARPGAPDGNPKVFAIEVDRGTEATIVFDDKLGKYSQAFADDAFDMLLLLVTGDAGLARHEQLRRSVTAAGLAEVTRLLAHADVCERKATRLPEPALVRVGGGGRRA